MDELLAQLWNHFEQLGSSPRLLAVPGNHDLVRPDQDDPSVILLQDWLIRQNVQTTFWENAQSPYRRIITQVFKNYIAWWEKQPFKVEDIHMGLLPGDLSVTIEKNGAKLGIVGLNTSFLQLTDDNYEGKLALHTRQFHEACGGDGTEWAKQHHACLLLTHHPPAWLNADSKKHLNGEIVAHGHFALHLCGHNHKTASREVIDGGTEPRRLWQGRSLFGLEYFGKENEGQRLHGYTAGRIELSGNKGILILWPREARQQGGQRRIVLDQSVVLTDDQHTPLREFDLLQPYIIKER